MRWPTPDELDRDPAPVRSDPDGAVPAAPPAAPEAEGKNRRPSQTEVLMDLAATADLFHAPNGDGFATVDVRGHSETLAVRGGFRRWLRQRYYEATGRAPGASAIEDAIAALEARAQFRGREEPTFLRVGRIGDRLYLDLGTHAWEAVEVDANGWRIVDRPPVRFTRAPGMQALPTPVRGSIDLLRPFTNVASDDDWILLVSWLLFALSMPGPYPVLAIHGEQGSAKSTLARVLRALVDPNTAALRAEPRKLDDLMIAARNAWCVVLDNLSHLPPWLSDAVCRISTGGGFSARRLYTDGEEALIDVQRPVLLNGIEELATRGDLLERSLLLYLPAIPDERRRTEKEFWEDFELVRPLVLGALLDAVSGALARLTSVVLVRKPRMADFARFATAAETALGWPPGAFMAAHGRNGTAANDLTLEASCVATPLRALAAEVRTWSGTSTELLHLLTVRVDDAARRAQGWPRNGKALGGILRRLAPNLRACGLAIDFNRREPGGNRRRLIEIRMVALSCVPTVPTDGGPSSALPSRLRPAASRCVPVASAAGDAQPEPNACISHRLGILGTQRDGRDGLSQPNPAGESPDEEGYL